MTTLPLEPLRSRLVNPWRLGNFGYGIGGLAVGAGVTAASTTGVDGGALKFFWAGLQTSSPMFATAAVIVAIILWSRSERNSAQHEARTLDYIAGMNTAARLREKDMEEKARLRARVRQLEDEAAGGRGAKRRSGR